MVYLTFDFVANGVFTLIEYETGTADTDKLTAILYNLHIFSVSLPVSYVEQCDHPIRNCQH